MSTQITNYQCPACTGPLRYDGERLVEAVLNGEKIK